MHIPKHIVNISVITIVVIIGYIIFHNLTSESNQSDNITLNTGSVLPISQSDTGTETDTGKRLQTLGESGSNWGMSPFGSGKPLEEEKTLEFKKPNTEWKTRTLSGITYVFGEGNPREVDMNNNQIEAMTKTCENNVSLVEKGVCDVELGFTYVTPEVEKYLLLALSDLNWSKLATECEKNFRARETYLTPESITQSIANDPTYLIFDRVFAPAFLDIERFISVETMTGLKVLNNNLIISLAKFVMNGMYDGASRGEPQPNPYGDCVDRYGKDIARNLIAATILYTHPLEDQKGIAHEVFTEWSIPFSFH